ncbi:hypothetical protein RRG08_043339 [Elysia crispata]|uniref:Uncharacterized protein n=1 Tax=Elysia crispata TaxID=231223 RepID=A0AAE1BBC9_9GAST|nr:hypothetical protein RRG08_043339 [Elysia crispata]
MQNRSHLTFPDDVSLFVKTVVSHLHSDSGFGGLLSLSQYGGHYTAVRNCLAWRTCDVAQCGRRNSDVALYALLNSDVALYALRNSDVALYALRNSGLAEHELRDSTEDQSGLALFAEPTGSVAAIFHSHGAVPSGQGPRVLAFNLPYTSDLGVNLRFLTWTEHISSRGDESLMCYM